MIERGLREGARRARHALHALTARQWLLAAEAGGWLVVAAVAVRAVPFRRIAPTLGRPQGESPNEVNERGTAACRDVRWAVQAVARRTPWVSTCLMQAIAAKAMLRRRGLASTLYLGVRDTSDGQRDLEAHAWLRCGGMMLTGGVQRHGYTVVATFADAPRGAPAP